MTRVSFQERGYRNQCTPSHERWLVLSDRGDESSESFEFELIGFEQAT